MVENRKSVRSIFNFLFQYSIFSAIHEARKK